MVSANWQAIEYINICPAHFKNSVQQSSKSNHINRSDRHAILFTFLTLGLYDFVFHMLSFMSWGAFW